VFLTFLAILVALFGDWLRTHIFKPRFTFRTAPPIPQLFGGEKYTMYRVLVINAGSAAQEVRALITSLTQPLNLQWTHFDGITRDISKNEQVYLDVIQEKNGKIFYYPWGDIIDVKEDILSDSKATEIKIQFNEKNCALGSVRLKFDPIAKTLEVI